MSPSAILFMAGSWVFVLGLTAFCFIRILSPRPRPRDGESTEKP